MTALCPRLLLSSLFDDIRFLVLCVGHIVRVEALYDGQVLKRLDSLFVLQVLRVSVLSSTTSYILLLNWLAC